MWVLRTRGFGLALLHGFVLKEEGRRFWKRQSFSYLVWSWYEFK